MMSLGDLFKKIRESLSRPEKEATVTSKIRMRGGKSMPPLPAYLKKDKFLHDTPPQKTAPPETPDMADAGSLKRPGQWLRNKLNPSAGEAKLVDNIEKTKKALKRSGGLNDAEIQLFLDNLLEEVPESGTEKQPLVPGKVPPGALK